MTAFLLLGFFASPVLYSAEALPAALRSIQVLNPMATIIGLYRHAVMGTPLPGWQAFVVLVAVVGATWTLGARILSRGAQVLDEHL